MLTMGSLCAGIGGFELAAEKVGGFETLWSNDNNKHCCAVLRKNFKHKVYECSITELTKGIIDPTDLICAGFPCQPFSKTGLRKGREDNRYIWPQILRLIRELKPKYILCENVANLANMEDGKVLRTIQDSLEDEAYEVELFDVPASGLSAPHSRRRIWIVAYPNKSWKVKNEGSIKQSNSRTGTIQTNQQERGRSTIHNSGLLDFSFSKLQKLFPWWRYEFQGFRITPDKRHLFGRFAGTEAEDFPIVSRNDDGLPHWMDRHYNRRIEMLGNTIQPQLAAVFLESIKQYNARV